MYLANPRATTKIYLFIYFKKSFFKLIMLHYKIFTNAKKVIKEQKSYKIYKKEEKEQI